MVKRLLALFAATAVSTMASFGVPVRAEAAAPAAAFVFGQNGSFTTNGGALTASLMATPRASAMDTVHHRLFTIDYNRVLVFNLNTDNTISDTVADYVLGEPNFTDSTNWNGARGMNAPTALAYDGITDRLYLADPVDGRVMVFDTSTITNFMNAVFVIGQASFGSVSYECAANRTNSPNGVAVDPYSRQLFVTDSYHYRVLVFDTTALANNMNASYVLGQPDFTTCNQGASQNMMGGAAGISVDSARKQVFLTDGSRNRVLVFSTISMTNGMNASYVIGQSTWTGTSSGLSATNLNAPQSVSTFGNYLVVSDQGNNRVLRYDLNSLANGMAASYVYGQQDFTSNSTGTTASTLSSPKSATIDPSGMYMFVADTANNRILAFYFNQSQTDVTVSVAPTFSFAVSGSASACNGITPTGTSSATGVNLKVASAGSLSSAVQVFTVGTNANTGFSIFQQGTAPTGPRTLTSVAGTNATPAAFGTGERFGYSTNDTNIAGFAGPLWAAISSARAPIMSRSALSASASNCVVYQVGTAAATTPAGSYTSTITYTAVPSF